MKYKAFPLCDKYLIYQDGRIFSTHRNRFLKPEITKKLYHRVNISGVRYMWHRVVAITWVKNPFKKPCINHKDRNRANNHYKNLEWCTQAENMQHAYPDGINLKNRGELNKGGGKLTSKKVIEIKNLLKKNTFSQAAIAVIYNVSAITISEIYWGKKWKHIEAGLIVPKNRYRLLNIGSNNPASKLTNEQVLNIRELIAAGNRQKDIAKKYGVSFNTVNRIRTKQTYSNL